MATSDVTYTCGHSGQVSGYNRREADEKASWARGRECPNCWIDSQRRADNEAARKATSERGLVALEGSEKQVAWANSIRIKALDNAGNQMTLQAAKPIARAVEMLGEERAQEAFEFCRAAELVARQALENETSARWWIDHRSDVDYYVCHAREVAMKTVLAPERIAAVAEKRAREEREEAERKAEQERRIAEHAAKTSAEEKAEVEAATFFVASVKLNGSAIIASGKDGRVASGWIMDGEWVITMIGDGESISDLRTCSEQGDRIGKECKEWMAQSKRG